MTVLQDLSPREVSIGQAARPTLPIALIAWAAVGIALNVGLARFTYGVMLPSLRRDLGLDYVTSGSLNAVHLAGYLIGTLAAPLLARRTGMPRLLVLAHLLVAVGAVLSAATPETPMSGPVILGLGRLATGLGAGAGIVAIFVLVFAAVSADRRPLVSAIVWSGMAAAIVASGLAVSFLLGSAIGWRSAFAVSAVLALAIAAFFPPRGTSVDVTPLEPSVVTARFAASELVTARWGFLIGTYLLFGVGYIAYATFAGARLAETHTPTIVVGLTWTAFGIASVVGAAATATALGAALIKRFALVGALACGAAGALVAGVNAPSTAVGGAVLVGLGLAATPTIVTAYVRERCSAAEYAKAFSYATAVLGIGQLVGPVAAGALADIFGTAAVPLFAAVAYGTGGVLAAWDAIVARGRG